MCCAQPKFAVTFVRCIFGEQVALLHLVFKEIAYFQHGGHHKQKSPVQGRPYHGETLTGDCLFRSKKRRGRQGGLVEVIWSPAPPSYFTSSGCANFYRDLSDSLDRIGTTDCELFAVLLAGHYPNRVICAVA